MTSVSRLSCNPPSSSLIDERWLSSSLMRAAWSNNETWTYCLHRRTHFLELLLRCLQRHASTSTIKSLQLKRQSTIKVYSLKLWWHDVMGDDSKLCQLICNHGSKVLTVNALKEYEILIFQNGNICDIVKKWSTKPKLNVTTNSCTCSTIVFVLQKFILSLESWVLQLHFVHLTLQQFLVLNNHALMDYINIILHKIILYYENVWLAHRK